MQNRRRFIYTAGLGASAVLLSRCATLGGNRAEAGWDMVPDILSRIKPPTFANRDFVITAYGAVGDGKLDCSDAFRKAIAECSQAGGGRVVVPDGRWLTGPITLK